MSVGSIQGVIGSVTGGTALANAFLVARQKINYDVQADDEVAFLFAYRDEDNIDLRADITDHFTEGNTAIQDQIAIRPTEVTLKGFIGELGDALPGILAQINQVASQLTVLAPYVPQLTVAALNAYNQAQQIYNAGASAFTTLTQAYDMVKDRTFQTKQQKAYGYFEKHFLNRDLFSVQTPWKIFPNMAISSLRATQEGDTNTVSDFTITFKQMKFVNTISSEFSVSQIAQGRAIQQKQDQANNGVQNPPYVGAFAPSSTQATSRQVFG